MKREDPFETRLQGLPGRQMPSAWRGEILCAARAAAGQRRPEFGVSLRSRLEALLASIFWPHPRAWAGLAAVWLVVFALSFASREPAPSGMAAQSVPPSPQLREMLKEQQQLLAELVEQDAPREASRGSSRPPQPRSEGFHSTIAV